MQRSSIFDTGLWHSDPGTSAKRDFTPEHGPFSQSAPPSLSSSSGFQVRRQPKTDHPYEKAEEAYKQLTGVGSKILRYFRLAVPQNSPVKVNPKTLMQKRVNAEYVASKLEAPSEDEKYTYELNQRLRRMHEAHNRHFSALMDIARPIKAKIDSIELAEFTRFITNFGIELETEDQYRAAMRSSTVDLILLIYLVKRYPEYGFSHFNFLLALAASGSPVDYFVKLNDELKQTYQPFEIYEIEWPLSEEGKQEETHVCEPPKSSYLY